MVGGFVCGLIALVWFVTGFARWVVGETTGAQLGAVASESSICSKAGVEMLSLGGNAADAVRCVVRYQ